MTHILFPDVCFLQTTSRMYFLLWDVFHKDLDCFQICKILFHWSGALSKIAHCRDKICKHRQCIKLLVVQAQKFETVSEFLAATTAAQLLQSCPTLYDPMDHSPPGTSVRGILQARILQQIATPSSRGSSQPRDQTCISQTSFIDRQVLYQQRHLVLYYFMRQKLMITGVQIMEDHILLGCKHSAIVSFRVKSRFLQRPLKTPPFFLTSQYPSSRGTPLYSRPHQCLSACCAF